MWFFYNLKQPQPGIFFIDLLSFFLQHWDVAQGHFSRCFGFQFGPKRKPFPFFKSHAFLLLLKCNFCLGASGFQHIMALQEVIHALTQIWSPTSCWRRLIFCRQTSAVHLRSLTGNAGPRLPHAPLLSAFRSFLLLSDVCFCLAAICSRWYLEYCVQYTEAGESKINLVDV